MEDIINYLNSIRRQYSQETLDESSVPENPVELLMTWIEEAANARALDPNAMVLSTVDEQGKPHGRVVLLRDMWKHQYPVFYTNYQSQKAKDIAHHPFVSLTFYWPELERQIRIEGEAKKLHDKKNDEYFSKRPRESKIAAWASEQSKEISSREELDERFQSFMKAFEGKEVKRPPHWGGFYIIPALYEFWQGRPNRMHDRIRYLKEENRWKISRLAP